MLIHTHAHTHVPGKTDLCGNTIVWQLVTTIVAIFRLYRPPTLFSVCLYCMCTLQCLQQLSSVMATEGGCATIRCCSLVVKDISACLRLHVAVYVDGTTN